MMSHPIVLTIAGSDSCAGAGIQADLKTIAAHRCYGASVITAVTAQNTTGIKGIVQMPAQSIKEQFEAVMEDMQVAAIKIGMLSGEENIIQLGELLEGVEIPIILDPIMISSSGVELLNKAAIKALQKHLFSKVTLLTPNIPEAALLAGKKIESVEDMKAACLEIEAPSILLKGGHMQGNIIVDVLYHDGEFSEFKHRKIKSQNTHGTGCTLSSAIASNLAQGLDMVEACDEAIVYLAKTILEAYPTGKGSGSLNHLYMIKGRNNG